MRFSYLLSAFLATLAVASPIVNSGAEADIVTRDETFEADIVTRDETFEADIVTRDETFEAATLETRAKGDTKPYELLSSVKSGLQDGKWYVFALKNPLGTKFDAIDYESKTDLEKLQKKLGFEHIRLITGQVKEEKKSGKVVKRDVVNLKFHDLAKTSKAEDSPIRLRHETWQIRDAKKENMLFVKETTDKKVKDLPDSDAGYKKDHPKYNVDNNNCASYVAFAKTKL